MSGARARAGFSLIELMIAVAIIGILAATAIPAFAGMINRSKTGEVSGNLDAMFKLANAYYATERAAQGADANHLNSCSFGDAGPTPTQALPNKQVFNPDATFRAMGFTIADYTYFSYGVITRTGNSTCSHAPDTAGLYTFYAHGDLDGDGLESTFELAAGSDSSNVLMHSRGIFTDHEYE